MQDTIFSSYCLCDDFLKAMGYRDDPQARVTTAQVMTVPLVASCFFGGNINAARLFLLEHGYITQALSQSRLNRRLHAVPLALWHALFGLLGGVFKECNPTHDYIVDSLPVPACDNIRIARCRLLGAPHSAEKEAHRARKKRIGAASPAKSVTSLACACICWSRAEVNPSSLSWHPAALLTLRLSNA
jgi:hypothetical protein